MKRLLPVQIRQAVSRLRRRQTAHRRALPSFLIIGTQKGGTDSLYAYLAEHPQVVGASTKEIHFFDENYQRGLKWYRSHFPLIDELRDREMHIGNAVLTGEASPYYIFHPLAVRRIAKVIPDSKLIVLLRNPVDRALSHYQHMVRLGLEPLSFSDAIKCEGSRLAGEIERIIAEQNYRSHSHRNHSYLSRGMYFEQMQQVYNWFRKEQVLVLQSEEFFESTQTIFDEVTDFLGLERTVLKDMNPRNVGEYSNSLGELREQLREYYAKSNERLFDLVGRRLDWT